MKLVVTSKRTPNLLAGAGLGPLIGAALSLVVLTACGSSGQGGDAPAEATGAAAEFPKDKLPAHLAKDLLLVAPKSDLDTPVFSDIVDIAPGEDVTLCTFTDVVLKEAAIFGESFGSQSTMGHHAIMQYTTKVQEPHTGPCGAMMDGQMLLGGAGGTGVSDKPTLPVNYGVEVPAGAQLVMNHHWINSSPDVVHAQAMMLARRLEAGGNTIKAGNLPMVGLGWEIPAQGQLTYSTECTYGEDVSYILALGHMHEWGSHVSIDVARKGGGTDTLIDKEWSPEDATNTKSGKIFTLDDPFVVNKGDTVRLTCNWQNTTSDAVGFPREMCVFFGYTIDSSYFCANGAWLSAGAVTSGGMGAQDIINNL